MLTKKHKKGEITTQQLVVLIILIASFVIILFLLLRLNLGGITNAEICRNSVVLKGKSILPSGPINCKTDYLCISGGQSCQDFSAYQTIKIDANQDLEKIKKDTMKAIADEMSNCWSKFGEGKINYGTRQGTSVKYAICSIISFDSKIQEKIPQISYQEFYLFLEKTKKDDTHTYLQYLYGANNINSVPIQSQIKIDLSADKIITKGKYSIITGINDNLSPFPDVFLNTYIIPTSETNSRLASDREFVTTA